jgi:hypothetical protein
MEQQTRMRKVAIADESPAFVAAAANYIGTIPGFTSPALRAPRRRRWR